ncbi:MAG: DMT family transporter, partial [Burkholderiales bacterium]
MLPGSLLAGVGWMALAIVCWTPLLSVAKRTLPVLDAFALGTLRYALGVALFVALLGAIEGRAALRFDGQLWRATLVGLIGIAGFNLFIWIGLGYTRPEHASIILALQSPLTALAVWLVHGQRPAPFTLGCVAAAIAGVVLVITKGDFSNALAGGSLLGDVLVFCGAVSWVTYTLAAHRFPGWSPLRFTVLT